MGFKWDIKGRIATHIADLDAHTKNFLELFRTGEYYPYPPAASAGAYSLTADRFYAVPLFIARAMTLDRIAIDVTGAGAGGTKARLGIYNNGTNLYPGTLELDAGTVDVDSTGVKAATIDKSLTKGLYWLVAISDGTPTLRGMTVYWSPLGHPSTGFDSVRAMWYKDDPESGTWFAALPNSFPSTGAKTSSGIRPSVRVASLD